MLVAQPETEAEEGRLCRLPSDGLQAPRPNCLAICLRRSCRLRLNGTGHTGRPKCGDQIITETRPGLHRAPLRIDVVTPARTCPWRRRTFPWSWPRSPDPCRRSGPCRNGCRPCRRSGPCRRWRRRSGLRRRRTTTVDMVAPARNRVAAAAAMAAPDLEVIFMGFPPTDCARCIAREPRSFRLKTAPGDSYASAAGLVTRPAKLILIDGRKEVAATTRARHDAEPLCCLFGTINP